jgi:hypothetical protein
MVQYGLREGSKPQITQIPQITAGGAPRISKLRKQSGPALPTRQEAKRGRFAYTAW